MRTIILIPARYASSRYPGKPLAMLEQPNGHRKSLIQMSYEAGCSVKGIDSVYVVTDDNRIRYAAEAFGAKVIMTSKHCRNGTERCSEALRRSSLEAELVVNLQGDAPLTPPWFIEELINTMRTDINADITTPVLEMDQKTYAQLFKGSHSLFTNRKVIWCQKYSSISPCRRLCLSPGGTEGLLRMDRKSTRTTRRARTIAVSGKRI